MEWLLSEITLAVIALLGMISHFFKKKVKGESITEIRDYFRDHFKSTVLALIATGIGYVAYLNTFQTESAVDVFFLFGVGYMCDSMFNKYESNVNP